MGQYETSTVLKEMGVFQEKTSPEAAITKLIP
jgi:hypothetical protein